MNSEELKKLLYVLRKNKLQYIKKNFSDEELRQKIFEEYLINNKFEYDPKKIPKLFSNNNIQYFTNGVSLYRLNNNFFDTNTTNLVLQKNTKKFEIVDESHFHIYFEFLKEKYGSISSYCDSCYLDKNEQYTYIDYIDLISSEVLTKRFDTDEIDTANLILKNPTYKISNSHPILHAENDIGKVYILGYKNTFKE